MTTPVELIGLALRQAGVLGVGQTADATDTNDCFAILNMMIGQWAVKRWLIYKLDNFAVTSTGAQTYTIGPTGNINVSLRPDRIESAFIRQLVQSQPNLIDYPLQLLFAREDYDNIALKTLNSFPSYLYYEPAYPLGVLYPWPIPQANIYAVHVTVKSVLSAFPDLTTDINLPPEYMEALLYNLAGRIRPLYQLDPDPTITALAAASLATIRASNTQIPRLDLPPEVVRNGIYNPYSDQIY